MEYDVIILGGGPGGYIAAERAGEAGLKTLLLEKGSLGGVCLNEGCIPTKTLLHSAKLFEVCKGGAQKYGIVCQKAQIDHKAVIARKDQVVKRLVSGVAAAMKKNGVEVVMAEGAIEGRSADGFVVSAQGKTYRGKNLIIATGSKPIIPPIPGLREGLESGVVMTHREALQEKEVPKRLAIIGGGVIGLEMASYFNSVGCEVQVVEMLDQIGGRADKEIAALLQKQYEKKGITFLLGAKVTEWKEGGLCFQKDGQNQKIECDKVLLSIGRRPVTQGFGLERLNPKMEREAIAVDDRCRASLPNLYAVGDCNGRSMLAHSAYRQGEVAVNCILGAKDIIRYHAVPGVIYTNPEAGAVGMTEKEALSQGYDVAVSKLPMAYSGRFVAENEGEEGMCKLIFDKKRKTLLGAHLLGNPASEIIFSCAMIIEAEMTADYIKKMIFPHPTVCEIIRECVFAAGL